MNSITVIGAGKLGRSLARLWQDKKTLSIRQVCNRSLSSAEQAIDFIGAGIAEEDSANIQPCDFLLIATPDTQIETVCRELAANHDWLDRCVVFHCSGALSSQALASATDRGAATASIHPVKSFADPAGAIRSFAGTFCGVEGDTVALEKLAPLFDALGGTFVQISPAHKTLYHCAAVVANNYLVTLVDAARQLHAEAGLDTQQSMMLLAPMLRETTDNLIRLGSEKSLTGPIARGDADTVRKHLAALAEADLDTDLSGLYKVLGRLTSRLADTSGSDPAQAAILKLLQ
ncbi:MAG: DUF2520 domain-containing protein [Gammaproteobacteria bacterium]|nr:DUF2520 domain-containing protein [Gammaproteobacteria bacterium]